MAKETLKVISAIDLPENKKVKEARAKAEAKK
jgi:hypothetical protein